MRRPALDQLLPQVMQEAIRPSSVLDGLLDVMAAHHAPAEVVLADLDAHLDPRRCPDAFVPFLARWVDLERLFTDAGEVLPSHPLLTSHRGRLRELVARAAELARWRGTARGLADFLAAATGVGGFRIDEDPRDADGARIAFHLRVHMPAAAAPLRAVVENILAQEKPAHVTCDLVMEV